MDSVERLLHEEINRLAAAPQPDPDIMLGRVRRRRVRSRVVTAAATTLLAVAGAGVAVMMVDDRQPVGPPRPPAVTSPGPIEFLDPDVGYALAGSCPSTADECSVWLARTADAGRTWTWRRVQDRVYPKTQSGPQLAVRILDARRVIVQDYGPTTFRLLTTDAGATWEPRPGEPSGTVERVAPGALVESDPPNVRLTVLGRDGTVAVLARQPPLDGMTDLGVPILADDGSVWIGGVKPDGPHLYVSRDRGFTWTDVAMPSAIGRPATIRYETRDGRAVYLLDPGQGRLWRTVDDGVTWQQIQSPDNRAYTGIATPDGGLWLTTGIGEKDYRVDAGALEASPAPADAIRCTIRIGARYQGFDPGDPDALVTSTDCTTWTDLTW